MIGMQEIRRVEKIKERLDNIGFRIVPSTLGNNMISISPKDEKCFPLLAKNATFLHGTLDDVERWLDGFQWARDYDRMLFGKTHNGKRVKKEEEIFQKRTFDILKGVESTLINNKK